MAFGEKRLRSAVAMVDLPEEDGPERPRIMGWRLAESRVNEEEEGGKGRVG